MSVAIVGEAGGWKKDLFPDELIPDILEFVVETWKAFNKPCRLDHEVLISKAFTKKLQQEKNIQNKLPFQIRPEIETSDSPMGKDGRIDICFIFMGTTRENIYFAFECKRLRIPQQAPKKPVTNNSDYVGEQGMMCFVTGKYSSNVKHGGMIGYIMDGKTTSAITSVTKLINKKRSDLKLSLGSSLDASSIMAKHPNIKETRHNLLNRKEFTIHHVFLPV